MPVASRNCTHKISLKIKDERASECLDERRLPVGIDDRRLLAGAPRLIFGYESLIILEMFTRRSLLATLFTGAASVLARIGFGDVPKTASPEYVNISYTRPEWISISKGLEFAKVEITKNREIVDVFVIVKADPKHNRIRVFSSYEEGKPLARTIEEWQKQTGALAMVNSAQYMADPYYMPCAPIICDGKLKGPKSNPSVRGMLVAEPLKAHLPLADLLDFDFEQYTPETYAQGVQHWPILLDRQGKIKVNKTGWQASRTIVAKDSKGHILFITTEGSFFTLYNLGLFLKETNERKDGGLHIHTAMNLDGGSEANMIVQTKRLSYVRHGAEQEDQKDAFNLFQLKRKIPGVIGVFPR
jgi:hypothetical protein